MRAGRARVICSHALVRSASAGRQYDAAQRFHIEIVGLQFAHHDFTRDIVLLWAGAYRKSMLCLWGSSCEVACDIRSAPRSIRFSAETADATAQQNLRLAPAFAKIYGAV